MARKVLVVEDDRNISDLIRMYLEKEGFEVITAFDGGSAVEKFRENQPDIVLLDIMLPVMDGWAVCAKIRESAKTPIIMLTAKAWCRTGYAGWIWERTTIWCSPL